MAKRSIEESTLTALADKIRAKTGQAGALTPDGTMLSALDTLPDSNALIADKPTTFGQVACLARAAQMRDIVWSPVGRIWLNDNYYDAGAIIHGMPYSSVRLYDYFIGYNISIHTFMTAVHNPKSVLYTKRSEEPNAVLWYGTNCSTFVSYAYDLPYHSATAIFGSLDCMEPVENIEDIRLCDAGCRTGGGAHVVLITGIERDRNGKIQYVTITHSSVRVKGERMTFDAFKGMAYPMYRNKNLWETGYLPTPYSPIAGEPVKEIVYSDLCTDRGDCVTIRTDETITVNPLVTDGYSEIKLYKDGEEINTYSVGDVELSGLAAGHYTAKMGDAETRFIVEDVSVEQNGTRYTFGGTGNPVRIVWKNASGYTLHAVDLTEEDIANGYIDSGYENEEAAQICVPFRNEYGFVVAKCEYSVPKPEPLLPSEYQQAAYLQTDGGQHIDTGVLASDHPDGITYMFSGNLDTVSDKPYLFGALADGSRSGNLRHSGEDVFILPLANVSGFCAVSNYVYTVGTDFTANLTATTVDPSAVSGDVNGVPFDYKDNVGATSTPMPSANVYLFWISGTTNTSTKFKGKLYGFTMTAADGTPIRKFVPCYRVADGVIGLYDTVEGKFYTNAGTGSFTKGADV